MTHPFLPRCPIRGSRSGREGLCESGPSHASSGHRPRGLQSCNQPEPRASGQKKLGRSRTPEPWIALPPASAEIRENLPEMVVDMFSTFLRRSLQRAQLPRPAKSSERLPNRCLPDSSKQHSRRTSPSLAAKFCSVRLPRGEPSVASIARRVRWRSDGYPQFL